MSKATSAHFDLEARGLRELGRTSIHYCNIGDEIARLCDAMPALARAPDGWGNGARVGLAACAPEPPGRRALLARLVGVGAAVHQAESRRRRGGGAEEHRALRG